MFVLVLCVCRQQLMGSMPKHMNVLDIIEIYRNPSMLACVNVRGLIVIYRCMQAIQTVI